MYTDQYLPSGTQYQRQTGTACSRRKYLRLVLQPGRLLHVFTSALSAFCNAKERGPTSQVGGVTAYEHEHQAAGAVQVYWMIEAFWRLGKAGLLLDQRQAQDGLAACCLACVLYEQEDI